MALHRCVLVIVQARAAQLAVVHRKPQGLDQMQRFWGQLAGMATQGGTSDPTKK